MDLEPILAQEDGDEFEFKLASKLVAAKMLAAPLRYGSYGVCIRDMATPFVALAGQLPMEMPIARPTMVFHVPHKEEDSEEKKAESRKQILSKLPGKSISEIGKKLRENPNTKSLLDEASVELSKNLERVEGVSFSSLRLRAKLTQSELAELVGVKQYQISKLEAGHSICLKTLKKIYKILGFPGDEILNAIKD